MMRNKIRGMFLGVAIGDSLGCPCEGWSAEKIKEIYGRITGYQSPAKGGHKYHAGLLAGGTTDDTQLTIAVAEALIEAKGFDMDAMAKHHVLAYKTSSDGWGRNTKGAMERLIAGAHWSQSGQYVEGSGMGNGIPMKSAPLGAFLVNKSFDSFDIADKMAVYTGMTHPNQMSVCSCLAHVFAIYRCLKTFSIDTFNTADIDYFINTVVNVSRLGEQYYPKTRNNDDITKRFETLRDIKPDTSTEQIIASYGKGHYYVYNSLPFTYAFFVRNPYTIDSLYDCASAGGDTDSNASMLGGLLGALHGPSIFPIDLVNGLQSKSEIIRTADAFADLFA